MGRRHHPCLSGLRVLGTRELRLVQSPPKKNAAHPKFALKAIGVVFASKGAYKALIEMVGTMSNFFKTTVLGLAGLSVFASEASAQFYAPDLTPQANNYQHIGGGLDLGLRNNGFNPHLGLGAGQVGAGLGAGLGASGIGQRARVGLGPLGAAVNSGVSRNGLGVAASSGIGNTGAALSGGLTGGGLGAGANARVLGFGPGASVGIGRNGPGLGASVAFGPIGTLLIGSHRNSYPGAQQTAAHIYPNQSASYYAPQSYGNPTNYSPAPTRQVQHRAYSQSRFSRCQGPWTC